MAEWSAQRGAEWWSEDDREARMIAMWNEGKSAATIAAILGCRSRNAVIGKVHRLGLSRTTLEQREGMRAARKARVTVVRIKYAGDSMHNAVAKTNALVRAAKTYAPPAPTIVDVSHAKLWTQRLFGECAYPVMGDGGDTWSCCAGTGGKTYCTPHAAVMFVAPKAKSPERVRRSA